MKYSFVFGKLGKDQPAKDADGETSSSAQYGANIGTITSNGNVSVAETAAELQAEFVCSERFSENFWSADERCISVLMHKLKSAKQTCGDILQMITTRASVEEDLGKKLMKLSRAGLGSEEVGSIKDALRTVRQEMESNAKSHLELARQLRAEVEKPLTSFMNDQRLKRRAQTSIIQKTEGDRNALRSQMRKLQDKRRSDTKKVGDLDLQVNGLQGVGDPKLRTKLERALVQQKATETEYIDVRLRLKEADQHWYNVWKSACDVFQVLEEERIEYLKTCLWTYTNLVSSNCVADDESMERIRQDLEKISVAEDIAAFIQTFGTGAPDPELAESAASSANANANVNSNANANGNSNGNGNGSLRNEAVRSAKPRHAPSADSEGPASGQAAANATGNAPSAHRQSTASGMNGGNGLQATALPTPVSSASGSAASPAAPFGSSPMHPAESPAYINRSSTPSSLGHHNTFASISTSGTARSGSILAHSMSSRPQTQETNQQQQQRPVSMHAAGSGAHMQPVGGSPAGIHSQAQHLFNGNANWNNRPGSSMQGPIDGGSIRRASNNDMYAMATGNQPQQPQQQPQSMQPQAMQPQPPHQFIQRTNSQMAMRPGDVAQPATGAYMTGAPNGVMYQGGPMDPRAPSSMGVYRAAGTETPLPMNTMQYQQQQQQQHLRPGTPSQQPQHLRPGTPSQQPQPLAGMDAYGGFGTYGAPAGLQQPPHLGSPRSRANTYNGPPHTGNFGTLTVNTQMHASPQPSFVGPAAGTGQHNSAPNSPYQQPVGIGNRPISSAGMHYTGVPPPSQTAVYRSATPVQQQSPQFVNGVMARPPTQMSHSPATRAHPQQMHPQHQQHQQRAPSVMGGGYQGHAQQHAHPQSTAAPASSNGNANTSGGNGNQVSESGKDILFYVKVLYDYDAENDKELSIKEGDVISVLAVSADGWWDGEMTDRRTGRPVQGTFPSNFTDPISH
ncbi:formin-binding protein [Coemansia sp. Benny D115]|nr:formin-binding protein [Coemansia sp. Benny D115]